ncbi:YihY/virulence factor BrkB family protein [Halalkalibacter krulwichiae]|uniref:YihY/virulence factor BrkB family protein n=1 Tax=Halalkalibacter krulwichiae TaxID=199441 RepID=UPI000826F3EC|nr:YihY/virulence factor BrkB family protein [Halalkalibacter krulwichiae]
MNNYSFMKILFTKLKTDPVLDWAATLAYYFMLSIFPLLIFILALVPYFRFDLDTVYSFIHDYVPEGLANVLGTTVLEVISEPQGGLVSFGVIATLWSASNGMNALIRAVNRSYNTEETRNFIKLRFMSILLTISMIIVIVVTLLLPVFGHVIIELFETYFFLPHETANILNTLRWIIGIGLMTFVLMVLYKIAPNVKLSFKQVILGAIVATVGWQIISVIFSTYVSNFSNYTATYGSLGGVIILMLWFFLTGLILVIGGQINAAMHQHIKKEKILS